MSNKRKQWGLYRTKAKDGGFRPTNLLGTFVGLGSQLFDTREEAIDHMVSHGGGYSFHLEIRKFNSRKDKQ